MARGADNMKKNHLKKNMKKIIKAIWIFNWFNSCGFCELVPVVGSRWDMERFGMIVVGSPRHADVLFISGYQTLKSIKVAQRIYEQMPDPKAVIAVGNCGNTGGVFYESYNLVGPINEIIPVDVHVIGCPPRPEAIINAVAKAWVKLETLEAKK
jgi:NADH-quinone oxidoreductase B subunit